MLEHHNGTIDETKTEEPVETEKKESLDDADDLLDEMK